MNNPIEVSSMLEVKFILSCFVRRGPQHGVSSGQDVCAVCLYTNVQKLTLFSTVLCLSVLH